MSINDRISTMLSDLSAHPSDVDLSAIASLLSEIREIISKDPDRVVTENGLSQPEAANIEGLKAKISSLENNLKSFNGLFGHLKNVLAGKVDIVYKNSKLRDEIIADLSSEALSVETFLKMQSQIEHQFNTAWFPQEKSISVSRDRVLVPANHKSGGSPWHHD
jgi:hypothetical protein